MMPRYYFHLRSVDQFIWDKEGVDLPDPLQPEVQPIRRRLSFMVDSCMRASMAAVGPLQSRMRVMNSSTLPPSEFGERR